mmetsp:Transcript_23455/g.42322  ORF Transcript_23455/g.42322 Transcript_23455/m.42322 type:complete len:352 (+) Transcript_23455:137-1192(+)|eukprot:CAMPEP_0197655408 /NCGR_PEP_ID=MMETSP1338-20131121/39435_1 /TAXON_ID=43686 ORGANISM="Pelagodinium beii, Strain RCC1491" /NCGR_SAMPLE_ID=MMETSP1338 /ASSEMBLY_ACC=CAM_ASM_000754 /LENGTH=351 /DNA_ID=CAMNT_0043231047 /DNA_START=87 /DNA_END=1142 /DNA_ORIENTATION=-
MQVRQKSDRRTQLQAPVAEAQERAMPSGLATTPQASLNGHTPAAADAGLESAFDMDLTVLAFAQWVSELKNKQANSQKSLQIELNTIKNAVNSNHSDLADFKRHGAAIQQQMQAETNEIRESLSAVFMEITAAVRNNTAADQDLKMKIQSLNEQAVRNETAFAQLADAADQSQSKLRSAVQEMQQSSERMREDLVALSQHTETLQTTVHDRSEKLQSATEILQQDLRIQLEKRKVQVQKMVHDVVNIGESLQSLVGDFGNQRKGASTAQSRLQSSLFSLDQTQRREAAAVASQPQLQYQMPAMTPAQVPARQPMSSLPGVSVMMPYGQPQPGVQPGMAYGAPVPMQNVVYR